MKKTFNRKSISISAELYRALEAYCHGEGIAIAGFVEARMRNELGLPSARGRRPSAKAVYVTEHPEQKVSKEIAASRLLNGTVSSFSIDGNGVVEQVEIRHG